MEQRRTLWLYVVFSLQLLCDTQETGDVRLFKGNENTVGIVQIYHDNFWKVVCGHSFTDEAAKVTCRQLGYERGTALPLGAFGGLIEEDAVPYKEIFQQCSTGEESKLLDCMFNPVWSCSEYTIAYASVVCSSGPKPSVPAVPVQLVSNRSFPEAGYFSPVKVYGREIWGGVCGEFWDDNDASVLCRQLGYHGGLATYYQSSSTVPVLISEINCEGEEGSLMTCPQNTTICYSNNTAGVVCYQNANQEPMLSFVGGAAHYGKLVISIDGKSGLVCNASNHDNGVTSRWFHEADAACRQLGYQDGKVLDEQFDTGSITDVILDGLYCPGGDSETLFQCQNGRWGEVSEQCKDKTPGVSIYCYQDVRLSGSLKVETDDVLAGYVEVFDGESLYGVCASDFTQNIAMVICKQLGYPYAEIVLPGSLGTSRSSYINNWYNISCNGDEERISNCTYSVGRCPSYSAHAGLVCRKLTTPDGYTFTLSNNYYGNVLSERYGITGKVCRKGWDDNDAKVMCKKAGHVSGLQLNTHNPLGNPIWASNFTCTGTETSLEECGYRTDLSEEWDCVSDTIPAGVLCYINEIPEKSKLVRLADGTSEGRGRAEVFNDVTGWGTICDSSWGNQDARVFCRQVGFADGQTQSSSFNKLPSDDPRKVVLSSLRCEGSETSIFDCASPGWLSVPSDCDSHERDAGVFCYKHVNIPFFSYGPVQFHSGEKYGLVCADGFDKKSAEVVCKKDNFNYGIPVCCSGFGPSPLEFTMSDVQCTGNEASLKDCPHIKDDPVCPSGQYAGVICTHFNQPFTKISADPQIKIRYFSHDGYVCTEDFTDADARVVCRVNNFMYGRAFKASGKGFENKIRWLRGLGCLGAETNVLQCGELSWGQIGLCSWDAVAAAICSNNESDIDIDIRLANGTDVSGRVEIKVMGEWGTICGEDFTKDEATVICKQLGFRAGINMPAGHSGPGSGEVILSELKCEGNESSVAECIWSGFGDTNKRCDHTKDASVTCFYNTQLAGSTVNNYGRLEMYDTLDHRWLAVCDSNINVNNIMIICRQMGFLDGRYQQGSPLGPTTTDISIVSLDCSDTSECSFEIGSCFSGKYVAVYCSYTSIINEYVEIKLPLSSFYGPVSIRRYGLWGHVCSNKFDDDDAHVVCSQLGYGSGVAVKTFATPGFPIIQGYVNCKGDEAEIKDCDRGPFIERHGCYNTDTVAGVICYNDPGLTFGTDDLDHESGLMKTGIEIKANGQSVYVSKVKFTDKDAAVYCYSVEYAGGETYHAGSGSYGVTDLSCDGSEESILKCPATWDPQKTSGKTGDLAGVTCFTAVRLVGGDPKFYGAVFTSKGVNNGLVCSKGFDNNDADVACSSLGFSFGLVLCCAAFGDLDDQPVMTNVQCTGNEEQFTECNHDDVGNEDCSRNYAAVACYSGNKPTEYSLSLPSTDTSTYTGNLVLTYLDIAGSICLDGWDDRDAHVACRELGYQTGMAYFAAKSVSGPYWTSQVNCNGNENKLSECGFTPFGEVTGCSTLQGHAGVICVDNDGVFSRLFGTRESRYGRVELSVAGEWRTICNTHWDNEDANVMCKMLDYRAGEAFQESYNKTGEGPVWDINFMCDGTEDSLTKCLSSGWKSATSETCARHTNDAGAFCYTSVKLSTGVGRRTDQGGVLFNRDNKWYTLCANYFTDTSAKVVCKELGFEDGLSESSQFGDLSQYGRLDTHKVMCTGDETDVTDCLVEEQCISENYASVVCYGFSLTTADPVSKTTKEPDDDFDALPIIIAVVLFICLVVIFIIVIYFVRKRKNPSEELLDINIISELPDGSVQVVNRLPNSAAQTPEVPRVAYKKHGGDHIASYTNQGCGTTIDVVSGNESEQRRPEHENNANNYEAIRRSSSQDPHFYSSLKGPNEETGAGYLQPTVSNVQKYNGNKLSESTNSHIALPNQDEVASPTEERHEPNFHQLTDINVDVQTNPNP